MSKCGDWTSLLSMYVIIYVMCHVVMYYNVLFVSFYREKKYDDAVEMYSKAIYYCPLDDDHKEQMVRII